MIYTTLNRIRAYSPWIDDWGSLLGSLNKTSADDDPLALSEVLKFNGLPGALWCLRAEPQHSSQWRLYAVAQARKVKYLLKDSRSFEVLNVSERFAKREASEEELQEARKVAFQAASPSVWVNNEILLCHNASYMACCSAYCTAEYRAYLAAYRATSYAADALALDEVESNIPKRAQLTTDFETLLQKWEAAPGEAAVEITPTEA